MNCDIIVYIFLSYETAKFSSYCMKLKTPSENPKASLIHLERPDPHIKDMTWVDKRAAYEDKLND